MSYQELFRRLLRNREELIDSHSPVEPALMRLAHSIDGGHALDPDDVEIVCAAAVLVAGEDVSGLLEGQDINTYETEIVKHCIEINRIVPPGKSRISTTRLDFESKGHIHSMLQSRWPHDSFLVFDKIAPFVKRLPLDYEGLRLAYGEASFSPAPICTLCDSEYIGTLQSKLVSINGVKLSSLFELHVQREYFDVIEDSCGVADGWSHLIDIAGIEKIAAVDAIPLLTADPLVSVSFGYAPHAVRESYLSVDDIADSYSRGCVVSCYPDCLLFCIAQDTEEHFADDRPPLIALPLESKSIDLQVLLEFMQKLVWR
jgi:hypothetical protein